MSKPPDVIVWLEADRAELVSQVLASLDGEFRVTGVGGPRSAKVTRVARAAGLEPTDDLRHLIVDRDPAYALLAAPGGVDIEDLAQLAQGEVTTLTLEPLYDRIGDVPAPGRGGRKAAHAAGLKAYGVPAFTEAEGFKLAADPHHALGDRRMTGVYHAGQPGEASLFARLLDAWVTALAWAALPQQIDATYVPATGAAEPNGSLRGLSGHLAAHARLPDGGAIVMQVSDRCGDSRRRLNVVGDQAQLRVTDTGYDLIHLESGPIDQSDHTPPPTQAQLVADQWRRVAAGAVAPPPRERLVEALACCHACLLSSRTTQPESPSNLMHMGP